MCSVDTDGNGKTTSVININGTTSDHTHVISNYVIEDTLSHDHEIRSVAVTKILPTNDVATNFVVNAYVIYDPTHCLPYGSEQSNPDGNRMMFTSIYLNGSIPTLKKLSLKLTSGSNLATNSVGGDRYYTAKTPGDTARGFDIGVYAEWGEYRYESSPGIFTTVPATPVDDGTRISFEVVTFLPPQLKTSGATIMVPGEIRDLMTLRVRAIVSSEGQSVGSEKNIVISSNNQWIPNISNLVPSLTRDSIDINSALSKIDSYGASQIYDAIDFASNRIIQAQTDNSDLKQYKKMVFVLTDGDENTSQYSLQQAVDSVNFIDGQNKTPIIPITLGKTSSSDLLSMQMMSYETNGFINQVNNYSSSQMDSLVNYMFVNKNLTVNNGSYINVISFAQPVLPSQIEIPNPIVPVGSSIRYRVATSYDGVNWGNWSQVNNGKSPIEFNSTESIQYLKYEITLVGNSSFETPVVINPPQLSYVKSNEFILFFKPIDVTMNNDEYVSSIMVTHEADIPFSSKVTYGFAQSDSIDPDDYIMFSADSHVILPSRYNELLNTDDGKTYFASNGRWYSGASVKVYMVNSQTSNGTLISPSLYSINASNGSVVFQNSQSLSDSFIICIDILPSLRLICKVANNDVQSATVHHVGIMYNVTKRFSRDLSGNIINMPINMLIR